MINDNVLKNMSTNSSEQDRYRLINEMGRYTDLRTIEIGNHKGVTLYADPSSGDIDLVTYGLSKEVNVVRGLSNLYAINTSQEPYFPTVSSLTNDVKAELLNEQLISAFFDIIKEETEGKFDIVKVIDLYTKGTNDAEEDKNTIKENNNETMGEDSRGPV